MLDLVLLHFEDGLKKETIVVQRDTIKINHFTIDPIGKIKPK
jgi:hypothetical protein